MTLDPSSLDVALRGSALALYFVLWSRYRGLEIRVAALERLAERLQDRTETLADRRPRR